MRRSEGVERADLGARLTPTERIVGISQAHIESLERRLDHLEQQRRELSEKSDRAREESEGRLERLRREMAPLTMENARLKEALGNTVANGLIATVSITLGGLGIGYAAYLPSHDVLQRSVASAGAALTVVGVVVLVVSSFRGNRARS